VDGSGLEIRNVTYRGRLVMKRGHAPILNVEYDPGGGCGCFRDWSDSETGFCVNGLASPTGSCNPGGPTGCVTNTDPGDVVTTCDRNEAGGAGGNTGSYTGIAVEDFGTEMVMTTHMSAGWYRYRVKWHFYLDGRIWPEYSFSAASATCTSASHRHHAYWRFDFDIDGNSLTPDVNDVVTEVNPTLGTSTTFTQEETRNWGSPASGIYWEVRDATTSAGYDIVPSSEDLLLPIDAFSKLDAMVVRYSPSSVDDGSPSCAINPNVAQLDNNELLGGQDVVFWYRSSALHTGGDPWECDIVGPSLIPQGFDPTGTGQGPAAPVDGLVLESARPNPFNPTTSIRFRVAEQQYVTVRLFDVTGREVAVLFDGWARENREEIVRVDGTNLPTGTYVVRLEGESVSGSTRVTLIR
jgi:hypothetical protein